MTTLDMPVADIIHGDPAREWGRVANGPNRVRIARQIDVNWDEFNQDNYLFSHATIVSSVKVEAEEGKPGLGHYIDPACSKLVNNNGNAWSSPVLLATFRSFVGAENYLEHVQIPELSKGKIIDAVLRPIVHESDNGGKADVFYADILVATNRRHDSLVRRIASGELDTMSMGCVCPWVQCSCCGVELGDNDPNCQHLDRQVLSTFVDENGIERVVAELCGRHLRDANGNFIRDANGNLVGDPESLKFIEASWVDKPAFLGAALNHFVHEVPEATKVLDMSTAGLEETVEDIFRMRVADTTGMIVLRVARAELIRRKREAAAERIAATWL